MRSSWAFLSFYVYQHPFDYLPRECLQLSTIYPAGKRIGDPKAVFTRCILSSHYLVSHETLFLDTFTSPSLSSCFKLLATVSM